MIGVGTYYHGLLTLRAYVRVADMLIFGYILLQSRRSRVSAGLRDRLFLLGYIECTLV